MALTEQTKAIGIILIAFYDTMQELEKITDIKQREQKKAVRLIMAINDLELLIGNKPPA